MAHLALAVHDEVRSRRFYERYFGFDAEPAQRMADGVLMLDDGRGFALALEETDEPISLPAFLHFGFRGAGSAEEVRAFRARLTQEGVPVTESWEEPGYVSVKCRDRTATSSSSPGSACKAGAIPRPVLGWRLAVTGGFRNEALGICTSWLVGPGGLTAWFGGGSPQTGKGVCPCDPESDSRCRYSRWS